MKKIKFNLNRETLIPSKMISDAPKSGKFDDYAEYILQNYEIECSEIDAKKYLRSIGAWEDSELEDHKTNLKRLIWLAVMDCWENKQKYFYMGE